MAELASKFNVECVIQHYSDQRTRRTNTRLTFKTAFQLGCMKISNCLYIGAIVNTKCAKILQLISKSAVYVMRLCMEYNRIETLDLI